MSDKIYCTISGVIFIIGALVHLGRLCADWELMLAGWVVPVWASWIGLIVGGALGGAGLWLGARGSI
jgi:hypothetical protein